MKFEMHTVLVPREVLVPTVVEELQNSAEGIQFRGALLGAPLSLASATDKTASLSVLQRHQHK